MAIPYNANIPQATDQPRNSQPLILQNFTNLQTFLDVNHVDFAQNDYGKHKWVSLPSQGTRPAGAPGTLNTEVALYSAISQYSGLIELYIQAQNSGPSISLTDSLQTVPGYFYVGGILVKWVQAVVPLAAVGVFAQEYTFNWNVAGTIPVFGTAPFMVLVTSQAPNAASYGHIDIYKSASATTLQFTLVTESLLSLGGWHGHNVFVVGFGT